MKTIDNKRLQAVRIMAAQGADTEKKITAMSIDDIVMIDKIRTEDIKLIRLLQKDIKNRNVIGFLTRGTDDDGKEETDADDDTNRGKHERQSGEYNGYAGSVRGDAGADAGSDPGMD